MAQLLGGTIFLRGLDESLGNGPRRRTNEDTHAAERANAVISRCFGQEILFAID
jgi:hypothetical protein